MSTLKWDKEFALEQAADDAELLQELLVIVHRFGKLLINLIRLSK